ncbi:MAG TPA: M20/M25/M40 family metallo-hydrolase [Longimicrobiales bacterium]|nr:M20/M25/M40 family metallo-hydrolase [Longimicrobiales bacterium]
MMTRLPTLAGRRFAGALAAAFSVLWTAPLQAQTFPTQNPTLRRIYAVGMDSSRLETEAHVLFDSLGPRLMGGPDLKRAQDWLVSQYSGWGIQAHEERYGTWRGWVRGHSHIDLVAPRNRTLQGQMVGYSPGTGGKPVALETIILPTFRDSTEFVRWLPQAKGKLVLISAGLPTCRPQDDWAMNAEPESRARMDTLMVETQKAWSVVRPGPGVDGASAGLRGTGYYPALGGGNLGVRLEEGGAAGIISSRPKLSWRIGGGRTPDQVVAAELQGRDGGFGGFAGALNTGWGAMEVFETYNTKTPAIALDCEDYGLVYRLTKDGDHPKIRLDLDSKLLGEQPVYNVIATIPGTEKPDEYVMLSAHFDSWDGSSGATDNGTGTLTMLEAMRILKTVYPHPKRTILVGHWSGEEEGEVGSKAFTEDHPEVLKGLEALFNQDNGTGRIVRIGGGGLVHAPEHLNAWLAEVPIEWRPRINGGAPVEAGRPAGGGSDDFSFGCRGLPAFGLGALPWDYGNVTWHTERDTYDKVVFDDLRYNATLTAMLVYLASEDPKRIPLDRVDLASLPPSPYGRGGDRATWPECAKAPRSTNPRLR